MLDWSSDDVADVFLGAIAQHVERPVDGTVLGDHVGFQPLAVHVGKQVVLDANGIVDPLEVESGREGGVGRSHALHPVTAIAIRQPRRPTRAPRF